MLFVLKLAVVANPGEQLGSPEALSLSQSRMVRAVYAGALDDARALVAQGWSDQRRSFTTPYYHSGLSVFAHQPYEESHKSVLSLACRLGHTAIVQLLLGELGTADDVARHIHAEEHGPDAQAWHDRYGDAMPWLSPWSWFSPLCTAIGHGHADIAVLLLDSPSITLPPSPFQSYPLLLACKNGQTEVVRRLLDFPLMDVTTEGFVNDSQHDAFGRWCSPLAVAIENGHLTIVELLLRTPGIRVDRGVSISFHEYETAWYHLHEGESGPPELLFADLRKRMICAEVSSRSYDPEDHCYDGKDEEEDENDWNDWAFECTPLALAAGRGNENIVRALVLHGADVNLGLDAEGQMPTCMQAQTTEFIIHKHAAPSAMARDNGHVAIERYLHKVVAARSIEKYLAKQRFQLILLRKLCESGRATLDSAAQALHSTTMMSPERRLMDRWLGRTTPMSARERRLLEWLFGEAVPLRTREDRIPAPQAPRFRTASVCLGDTDSGPIRLIIEFWQ